MAEQGSGRSFAMNAPQCTLLYPRRVAAIGTSLAAFAIMVGLQLASARNDDGSRTFFLQAASAPSADSHEAVQRSPLRLAGPVRQQHAERAAAVMKMVARRPAKATAKTRMAAKLVIKPVSGPVTLLTDATLMRGDAIMTVRGIRIFTGANAFPHRDADFVVLGGVGGLPRSVSRTLLAMDSLPRG